MAILAFMLLVVKLLSLTSQICCETDDTMTQFESLPDGTTLVSQGGTYELGFFSPGSSTNRYLGIWFRNVSVKTVVWVANRDNPLANENSGKLSITKEGNLVLLSKNGTAHWSTNQTTKGSSGVIVAQLLVSGNFVLRDEKEKESDSGEYLWQSFDYPTDTFLPGMKIGWNLTSGLNRHLTAWKSWDDPSSGTLTYGFFKTEIPEMEIRNGSTILYRTGPWNGRRYSATPSLKNPPLFKVYFVREKDEFYYKYNPMDPLLISRSVINQTVYAFQRFTLNEENRRWQPYTSVPRDSCDSYEHCGSFGSCSVVDKSPPPPECECLSGFTPKSPQNWALNNWSQGCLRAEPWSCRERGKDGFTKFQNVKVPDTHTSWINTSMTLDECNAKCWENCSCTAYANSNITGEGSGCILWFGDLFDLRQLPDAGQDLYVRLAASETGYAKDGSHKMVVVVGSMVASIFLILLTLTLIWWGRKFKVREETGIIKMKVIKKNEDEQEDLELPLFDFYTVTIATDNFSKDKKLGEGGFGPVYKGTLPDGQDIAVKRLSHSSTQGMIEFKNEVIFCSKFQHRNLVKVLGCCIEGQEKLLIYEYMPNKSLDFFLFDSSQSKLLDWSRRFNIISGIARGLLYLHQDSRFRIIHRDLKASNVLLDDNMNPRISDFGLARMCGGQVTKLKAAQAE